MHKMSLAVTAATALLLAGPAMAQNAVPADGDAAATATATFMDLEGNELGQLTLTETAGGVQITGTVSRIPNGQRGFHIHETGDCDASTGFESAGGHFNPTGAQHGHENPEGPHAGDMPNQTAGAEGEMVVDVTNPMVSLLEGRPGYLFDADGSALMIHSGADDYRTDPGGNAGDRIACAVIEPGV